MLNFLADPRRALRELARTAVEGGVAACYVWDYADGMAMLRHFGDAATDLDPAASRLDEGERFPLCRPGPLRDLWGEAGLGAVEVHPIDVAMTFTDFDDYWVPFLGGQGPAPGYVTSLSEDHRRSLRDLIIVRLPVGEDGRIRLTARAWAVQGTAPGHPSRRP